ncbi:maltase 1-like [Pseudomyrmex gracilis]|uniref:maltase 1-like n=1 Tax=Pseudomyrmex gracilis TaxID=219809 RepID=UPI000995997E|nr:maltase 1-like [Pseudomyrmex gracilis]
MSRATCAWIVLLLASNTFAVIKNKGWWKNTVFYQVYPRSFMDSDNDGVGDLKGITSKLQHFVDSGIGGIWLSPIYASPMVDFGYDISDFKDVDKRFGTMQDLEELIAKAKKLGVKVILDLVPNHTSDKHEWFQKSLVGEGKYKDYYVWKNGKNNNRLPPNNWISVFSGSAWNCSNSVRNQCYFHQFDYRQPDLNYSNPEVRDEMEDVIKYWLRKGIDGFRVDAIPHLFENSNFPDEPRSYAPGATERDYTYLDHIYTKDDQRTYDMVASWRKVLDDYADYHNEDEKVMMTEAYTNLANTTKYYKFGAQVPFNFKFITDVNNNSKPTEFKRIIDDWMANTPSDGSPNWVMGNHDRSRTASRYPGRGDQMTMLEMILPGVAVTYNGEEIGMLDKRDISWEDTKDPQACNAGKDKYQSQSRDPNRTPFQWDGTINAGFNKGNRTWLPVHENYKTLNLANQKAAKESHYKIYTSLTTLRRTRLALQRGTLKTLVQNNNKVLTVIRRYGVDSVILLMNFDDKVAQVVNLSGEGLPSILTVRVATIGSPVKAGTTVKTQAVNLPAKAALVLIS